MFHLAWRFTGNAADAQDVLQETFTYLLRKFPGFELTAAMTTFLYPVVKHLSLAAKEKGRRFNTQEDLGEPAADDPVPTPDAARAELAEALSHLSGDQREVLLMRFVDGLTLDEIAQALEQPAGTIKSRLYRVLQSLRDDPRMKKYFLE